MSDIYAGRIEPDYAGDDRSFADGDLITTPPSLLQPSDISPGRAEALSYEASRTLQLLLQTLSGTGLVANVVVLCIAVVAAVGRRRSRGAAAAAAAGSSFFVHHCILDAAKSALCVAFSDVMVPLAGRGGSSGQFVATTAFTSAVTVAAASFDGNDTGRDNAIVDDLLGGDGRSGSSVGAAEAKAQECMAVGTVYIVLVTTSVFNMLAITVNQNYHFTSQFVEGSRDLNDPYCVAFGVGIIWFASVIINVGIAFLPSQPVLLSTTVSTATRAEDDDDSPNANSTLRLLLSPEEEQQPPMPPIQLSGCPYMYGMTGSYVLNVLWITLVTLALALNAFYLRRLRADISDRGYRRIIGLLHDSAARFSLAGSVVVTATRRPQSERRGSSAATRPAEIGASSSAAVTAAGTRPLAAGSRPSFGGSSSAATSAMRRADVERILVKAARHLYILLAMLVTFVALWYPLLVLTVVDPFLAAPAPAYLALTTLARVHSAFTPAFFSFYYLESLADRAEASAAQQASGKSSTVDTRPTDDGAATAGDYDRKKLEGTTGSRSIRSVYGSDGNDPGDGGGEKDWLLEVVKGAQPGSTIEAGRHEGASTEARTLYDQSETITRAAAVRARAAATSLRRTDSDYSAGSRTRLLAESASPSPLAAGKRRPQQQQLLLQRAVSPRKAAADGVYCRQQQQQRPPRPTVSSAASSTTPLSGSCSSCGHLYSPSQPTAHNSAAGTPHGHLPLLLQQPLLSCHATSAKAEQQLYAHGAWTPAGTARYFCDIAAEPVASQHACRVDSLQNGGTIEAKPRLWQQHQQNAWIYTAECHRLMNDGSDCCGCLIERGCSGHALLVDAHMLRLPPPRRSHSCPEQLLSTTEVAAGRGHLMEAQPYEGQSPSVAEQYRTPMTHRQAQAIRTAAAAAAAAWPTAVGRRHEAVLTDRSYFADEVGSRSAGASPCTRRSAYRARGRQAPASATPERASPTQAGRRRWQQRPPLRRECSSASSSASSAPGSAGSTARRIAAAATGCSAVPASRHASVRYGCTDGDSVAAAIAAAAAAAAATSSNRPGNEADDFIGTPNADDVTVYDNDDNGDQVIQDALDANGYSRASTTTTTAVTTVPAPGITWQQPTAVVHAATGSYIVLAVSTVRVIEGQPPLLPPPAGRGVLPEAAASDTGKREASWV